MEKAKTKVEEEEENVTPLAKMAASPINSNSEDSNQPKQNDLSSPSPPSSINNGNNSAKSCKGCLYYSSFMKSDSRNPLCVGLTRSLPNVIVDKSEMEASKENRKLREFRYACVGYSLYTDRKGKPSNGQQGQTELPVCVGLEILVDRGPSTVDSPAPSHIPNREVNFPGNALPQRQSPRPAANSAGEEFFGRFTRNANLVARGVAKNIRRVGNQIKQGIDDALYPYRRRPK